MHGKEGILVLGLAWGALLVGRAEVDDVLGGRGRGERVVVVGDEELAAGRDVIEEAEAEDAAAGRVDARHKARVRALAARRVHEVRRRPGVGAVAVEWAEPEVPDARAGHLEREVAVRRRLRRHRRRVGRPARSRRVTRK